MADRSRPLIIFLVLFFFPLPGMSRVTLGQESPQISFSPAAALPGDNVSLPVYLSLAEGLELSSIHLTISFPPQLLSFLAAEPSFVTQMAGAQIETELETGQTEGSQSLLVLQFVLSEASGDGIPVGLLGYLSFEMSQEAQLESRLPLKTSASGTMVETGQEISLGTEEAVIGVGEPLIFSCFFYMH